MVYSICVKMVDTLVYTYPLAALFHPTHMYIVENYANRIVSVETNSIFISRLRNFVGYRLLNRVQTLGAFFLKKKILKKKLPFSFIT